MNEIEPPFEVIVFDRSVESDDVFSLDLRRADGIELPAFTAGAHIDLHLLPQLVRQYSLCNDPSERHRYRLGIQLAEDSRGGSIAAHGLKVGDRVAISPPRNHFPLVEAAPRSLLIGGGIGITPLMTMSHRLMALGANFALHYCVRTPKRAAFLDEMQHSAFGGRLHLHYSAGAEQQRFTVGTSLPEPDDASHLYVCGSTRFIDWVTADAASQGWKNIHQEYFNADIDSSGEAFTVQTTRSGLEIEVPPDRTISQVLQDHGLKLPLSCEQGVCGACLTPVVEGVPDHRDLYQTDEEKECDGQIAICCSRSKTRVLVLDL